MDLNLFWSKIDKTNDCWNWTAATDRDGYGVWSVRHGKTLKQYRSHRLSYLFANEKLDETLTIDHLCKNKKCVNPDHLEQVSAIENIRRSESFHGTKSHCKNGHEFNELNTRLNGTFRICRTCHNESSLRSYNKMKVNK